MNIWRWCLLGLSTTVLFGLFVYLGGSPLTGLSANGTSVEIGSLELDPNTGGTVAITARDVPDGSGLGGYDLTVEFDPQVVQVGEIRGGDPPFANTAAVNVDNATGRARLVAFHTQASGPVGDVVLARLDISATGASGTNSPLRITVISLIDVTGANLAATTTDGAVFIPYQGAIPAIPRFAPPPTPTVAPVSPPESAPNPDPTTRPTTAPVPDPTARPLTAPVPAPIITGGNAGGGGETQVVAPETIVEPTIQTAQEAPAVAPTSQPLTVLSSPPEGMPNATPSATSTGEVQKSPPLSAAPSNIVESPMPVENATVLAEPEPVNALPIWAWALIGLGSIAALIWGGILYLHLRDRV